MVVVVAMAIPVKRSTKVIPINIPCFLFILTEIFRYVFYTLKNMMEI